MGAFDMLSDDDPRVIAHEKSKLISKYSKSLSDYTEEELIQELRNRKKSKLKQREEIENRRKIIKKELKRLDQERLKHVQELNKLSRR